MNPSLTQPAIAPKQGAPMDLEFAKIPVRQAPDEASASTAPMRRSSNLPEPAPTTTKNQTIDKLLKEASTDMKRAEAPAQKSSSHKPMVAISCAIVAAIALSGAAYMAFKQ